MSCNITLVSTNCEVLSTGELSGAGPETLAMGCAPRNVSLAIQKSSPRITILIAWVRIIGVPFVASHTLPMQQRKCQIKKTVCENKRHFKTQKGPGEQFQLTSQLPPSKLHNSWLKWFPSIPIVDCKPTTNLMRPHEIVPRLGK